jgi:hypothetical protein
MVPLWLCPIYELEIGEQNPDRRLSGFLFSSNDQKISRLSTILLDHSGVFVGVLEGRCGKTQSD